VKSGPSSFRQPAQGNGRDERWGLRREFIAADWQFCEQVLDKDEAMKVLSSGW
jgi:hypothetical protein